MDSRQLDKNPSNALAVAYLNKEKQIYREPDYGSVEIVNDIRLVCLSDNKMTEKERIEIVFNIRPKLKVMNKRLKGWQELSSTPLCQTSGHEIDEGSREKADKKSIVNDCGMNRWKRSGRKSIRNN